MAQIQAEHIIFAIGNATGLRHRIFAVTPAKCRAGARFGCGSFKIGRARNSWQ
jgi:xanthine/uracil/vitamin C permease (AzgA family)